jgi:hypothetical protein
MSVLSSRVKMSKKNAATGRCMIIKGLCDKGVADRKGYGSVSRCKRGYTI